MNRKVAQALLGAAVLAALAGCAYQDPLALPDLGPSARSSQQPYGGYNPYYGSGYNYGYSSGYRPGYDPYYSPYYGSGDPRYYAPGVVYVPYPRYVPVPCADTNQDGRCDQQPPKHRGQHDGGGPDDARPHDQPNDVERPPRPRDDSPGHGPRMRRGEDDRYTAPGMAPLIAPRAPAAPSAGVPPPPPRPAQARPPEPPRRAAPPPDRGPRVSPRPPAATSDDRSPSRPTPEP
jgi:predicted small lipoprotein YifL